MVTRKCLKISCAISVVLLLIIVGVMLTLYFTILKPKQPILIPQPVTLLHLHSDSPLEFNLTLGLTVTVDNRNYGSFTYQDSMLYINYHDTEVANGLLAADTIPARAKHNISTSVVVFGDRLVTNVNFKSDVFGGVMNFTSSSVLHGEAKVLKFIKKKATSYTTCNISIHITQRTPYSVCKNELKL
ncbi:hypothetical protein BT93_E2139 [Corymbia citriodora subsp. variegata]|nr:hypothetical protein BT93_E2139 [Corymbia citriodora subsp. variegata]